MNEIKKCIDTALSGMTLSPDFINQVTDPRKHLRQPVLPDQKGTSAHRAGHTLHQAQNPLCTPVRKLRHIAAAILCIALLGTTAIAAGSLFYSRSSVNQQALPEPDMMKVIPLQPVDGAVIKDAHLEKTYTSMKTLEDELGIKLLGTNLAVDNPYIKIDYVKIGDGYNRIDINDYLVGDLTNIREWNGEDIDTATGGNDKRYAWTQGATYQGPIHLQIEIISDPSQRGLEMEYMGDIQYIETFTSGQGYTVNVLQGTISEEQQAGLPDDFVPTTHMVFVADGIRYTLWGRVPVQTMKEIINAMQYDK